MRLSRLGVAVDGSTFDVNHTGLAKYFIGRNSDEIDLDLGKYSAYRTVSHKHACISYDTNLRQFTLTNFGRNGSRVNEELITLSSDIRTLKPGDVVEIGRVKLTFFRV